MVNSGQLILFWKLIHPDQLDSSAFIVHKWNLEVKVCLEIRRGRKGRALGRGEGNGKGGYFLTLFGREFLKGMGREKNACDWCFFLFVLRVLWKEKNGLENLAKPSKTPLRYLLTNKWVQITNVSSDVNQWWFVNGSNHFPLESWKMELNMRRPGDCNLLC